METISDINLRIAEIINNIRMVILTKNDEHKLIIVNKNEVKVKTKSSAIRQMVLEK
jgi:hypothetical protein